MYIRLKHYALFPCIENTIAKIHSSWALLKVDGSFSFQLRYTRTSSDTTPNVTIEAWSKCCCCCWLLNAECWICINAECWMLNAAGRSQMFTHVRCMAHCCTQFKTVKVKCLELTGVELDWELKSIQKSGPHSSQWAGASLQNYW